MDSIASTSLGAVFIVGVECTAVRILDLVLFLSRHRSGGRRQHLLARNPCSSSSELFRIVPVVTADVSLSLSKVFAWFRHAL
jgi:hypothetical protein